YDEAWVNKTNFIVERLSQAYLGHTNHKSSTYVERTKGALQAFNSVFYDTLESHINLISNINQQPLLVYDETKLQKEIILDSLNYRLISSDTELTFDYTGIVKEDKNPKSDSIFKALLSELLNNSEIEKDIPNFQDLNK